VITLRAPCCLTAPEKNRSAAATSRRLLEEKVDGSTLPIDGAIEVDPLAFDFDVGFIHMPGVADRPCVGLARWMISRRESNAKTIDPASRL
jgi:hypothetical protein